MTRSALHIARAARISRADLLPSIQRGTMRRAVLFSLTLCAASTLSATPALAYVRTQTCDPTGATSRICRPDQTPTFVYWKSSCLTYYINRRGSRDFNGIPDELIEVVKRSFDAWSQPPCSDIRFALGGLTCNENVGREDRNITGGNQNLVIWRDLEWEHSSSAIAVTTVSPNPNTGEILDADIEMNGFYFTFANLNEPDEFLTDVQNTLTHEVGHFIGFDHELAVPEATMFPDAFGGELNKRELHSDDITGLCDVYTARDTTPACLPRHVTDHTCTLEYGGELVCGTAAGGSSGPHRPVRPDVLALCGLLTAASLASRARRRRQRSTRQLGG